MNASVAFSSKAIFEHFTDMDSSNLYEDEVKLLQPEIFNEAALHLQEERMFVKIHDAYILNKAGRPIVPTETSKCALYFIRNPLDIVGSFANHKETSFQEAINDINNPMLRVSMQNEHSSTNTQFRQLIYDWSEHVISWTGVLPFPVMVIRYEDMLMDSFATFRKAVEFMRLKASEEDILHAINASNFDKLKEMEEKSGFREMETKSKSFFRSGSMGNWKKELTDEQVESITDRHRLIMSRYNY